MYYVGTICDMKLVEISDAKQILDFRLNPKLNRFLSVTSDDINAQKKWINDYKEREIRKIEYYFMVLNKIRIPIGTIRIYNIDYNSRRFTIGSWIIKPNEDARAGIEALLAAEMFAFFYLNLDENYFDVRKANKTVVRFHKQRGACVIGEDDINYFFILKKHEFEKYLYSIHEIITIGKFIQ